MCFTSRKLLCALLLLVLLAGQPGSRAHDVVQKNQSTMPSPNHQGYFRSSAQNPRGSRVLLQQHVQTHERRERRGRRMKGRANLQGKQSLAGGTTRGRQSFEQWPLHYLATFEGLGSTFTQSLWIWRLAQHVGRPVLLSPQTSFEHYPDVGVYSLCDVFVLPSSIACTAEPPFQVAKEHDCVSIAPPNLAFLDKEVEKLVRFQRKGRGMFKKTECFAGALFRLTEKFHGRTLTEYGPANYTLTPIYEQLRKAAWTALGQRVGESDAEQAGSLFAVVHWRRGDQLHTRCGPDSITPDFSVNCAQTAAAFVNATQTALDGVATTPVRTYVATNERNATLLAELRAAGFFLWEDVSGAVQESMGRALSSLDVFVVELALMCDAEHFIAWGTSTLHPIVAWCRDRLSRRRRAATGS